MTGNRLVEFRHRHISLMEITRGKEITGFATRIEFPLRYYSNRGIEY